MIYRYPAYLANLGRVEDNRSVSTSQSGCGNQAGRPAVQHWASSAGCKGPLSLCHVIGILFGLGYHARYTAPRPNRAIHIIEVTNQGDPCGQVV